MSELAERAVKEGITFDKEVTQDAKDTAPSTVTTEQTNASNVKEAAPVEKTDAGLVEQPKRERFEDNPGFKALRKQKEELAEQVRKAAEREERLLKALEAQQGGKKAEVVDEKETAKRELMNLLGLGDLQKKIDALESRSSELSSRETDQAFDKEEQRISESCQKFGLEVNTVKAELQTWLDEHPIFGKMNDLPPGSYELAFKSIYFDKSSELAEKAASLKQIKERDKLRQANTESPNNSSTDKGENRPVSMRERLQNMIKDGGGSVSI